MLKSATDEGRAMNRSTVFPDDFLIALRALINVHYSIYARIPPQGIYFEGLVQEAFKRIKKPFTLIEGTARNLPSHDLLVEDMKISLKTETGAGTDPQRINITKLCTTEREPWTPEVLIPRVLDHLEKYDVILMLRAIWQPPMIHYQLLEIPVDVLKLIQIAKLHPVGQRKGRQSLGADIYRGKDKVFHVHFDGSDGKCQVRNLELKHCVMLLEWDLHIGD
jgi:Type II site-specific deoxyribonuclease